MTAALRKLVMIHTNDIHSHFEQMPKIAALINELKSKHSQDIVVTMDCGDHMDRMRMETEGTQGIANIAVMNATGYDIATIGNNEGLTLTADSLAADYDVQAQFVTVCCNLLDAKTMLQPNWLKPYHIKVVNGVRLGFIGVTAFFYKFYDLLGWKALEPMQTTAEWVGFLKDQVDVLIVLSHLGLRYDQQMAQTIPGIDLIFGAHTHHLLEQPQVIGQTFLLAAGCYGQYVGEVEIAYDIVQHRLIDVNGRCIAVDPFANDAAVTQLIQHQQAESAMALRQVVSVLREPLAVDWHNESRLGNLLAAGLRKWVDSEIGIVNSGQLLQCLRPGEITLEHLLQLCPSPINPCKMQLRGDHILQALEESFLTVNQEKHIRGFGFRGVMLGNLCVDGLMIEYNLAREPMHLIERVWVNGQRLIADKMYLVGTIDMFTFGIGYLSLQKGENMTFYLPQFLRDLLAKELQSEEAIYNSQVLRYVVT